MTYSTEHFGHEAVTGVPEERSTLASFIDHSESFWSDLDKSKEGVVQVRSTAKISHTVKHMNVLQVMPKERGKWLLNDLLV